MKTSVAYKLAELARKSGYKFNPDRSSEVIAMREELASLENSSISFQVSGYDDGSWSAVSTNVEGLITGSRNQADMDDMIKDAIFTYYGIPAKYAEDQLLRNIGLPVNTERQVLVTT